MPSTKGAITLTLISNGFPVNFSRITRVAAIGAVAALALTACAANEGAPDTSKTPDASTSLSGTLVGAGASSQQVAVQTWTAGFQIGNPDATVDYDPAGSGTGRESFQQGAISFAGSDRAFKLDEITAGGFGACDANSGIIELPAYISPIAIVFNVDGVESLNMDAATIAGIFAGTITNWNDPVIAAANPDAKLPDLAISPVHRSDKSGTTGNFTDYLAAAAPSVWSFGSVEEWPVQSGEAAQGTSGVVAAVKGGQGTIGYADASQAGTLGTVAVGVGAEFVPYSPEAAAAVVDASPLEADRTAGDLAIKIDRTTEAAGVYPIILVSYLIGCETYADAKIAPLVKGFFEYAISAEGQDAAAASAGSAPISSKLREQASAAIALIK